MHEFRFKLKKFTSQYLKYVGPTINYFGHEFWWRISSL